ncbi:Ail/Lom family outer membrane beta-barrel protein, partial [Escherichia coli]|nr:Ail/Lom family outer membrane beta-barrel protein [Escherichia coli]
MRKIFSAFVLLFFSCVGYAHGAAGDSTVVLGYVISQSDALQKSTKAHHYLTENFVRDYNASGSEYTASGYANTGDEMRGISVKYRYEITDNWGVIASFSHVSDDWQGSVNASKVEGTTTTWAWPSTSADGEIKGRRTSLMLGPVYRVNDWFSGYVMAGGARTEIDYRLSGVIRSYAQSSGIALSSSDDETSFAWSAGVQINPVDFLAVDLAYESSGSGDWRTDGFIVGVGY